jgi:aerobic carbon-monoxide dehydrogenase large subunit
MTSSARERPAGAVATLQDPAAAGNGAAAYVGSRVNRIEDARLLTGHGTFVDDISRPGMLHACFVRSPLARARIRGIETGEAIALPGVHAVFAADDLNKGVHAQWHTSIGPDSPETPRPPLAQNEVRFVGDPVALVVADSRYLAEDAADLVTVDYEPLPAVVNYMDAASMQERVHEGCPGNVVGEIAGPPATDLEPVFASAAHVVSETIYQQAYAAVPIETRGMVVEWAAASGELTIWAATQGSHEVRLFCSRLLDLPEQRIRVITRDTGGGFGQKAFIQREEMCLMLAAPLVPGPLKWIEDRRENLMAAGQSRHEHGAVRMAFDHDGAILAAQIDHVQDVGAYPTPWPGRSGSVVGGLFPGPYRIPRGSFTSRAIYTNTAGRTPYRGPWQFESLAREVLLDVAARRLNLDPVVLRRRNLLRRDDLPYTNAAGFTYDHITPAETFEQALAMLHYEEFRRQQAEARASGRYLGVGTCTYVEPTTAGFGMYASEGATIRIEPSGKVNVYVAGGSTGNSIETTVVQMVADALAVGIHDVATIQGDTAVTPYGAGTGGSRSASMTAGAVAESSAVLRDKLLALAAHRLGAAAEDVELASGRASLRGTPTAGISYAELARLAYFAPDALPPGMETGLEASCRYRTPMPFVWANATHLCTCEVDVSTGEVSLLRYIVSEDCGPMVNPSVVEGQIAGGAVQGIGGVLYEHLAYDADGNPITTTFMDYLLPTTTEVPVIEHGHIETRSAGPGGYKGVGEGGAIGAPPAVVNAVADALSPFGVTVTRLPLGPSAVLALLEDVRTRQEAP